MKPNLELFGLIGDAEARLSNPVQSKPANLVSIRIHLPNDDPHETIILGCVKEGLALCKPHKGDGTQETGIKRWRLVGTVAAYKKQAETIRDFLLEGIDWASWGVFGVTDRDSLPQECVTRHLEARKKFEGEFIG